MPISREIDYMSPNRVMSPERSVPAAAARAIAEGLRPEAWAMSTAEVKGDALAGVGLIIAGEHHISTDTVKKRLHNVFRKTGVRNRVQLFLLISGEESGGGSVTPPAGSASASCWAANARTVPVVFATHDGHSAARGTCPTSLAGVCPGGFPERCCRP